MSIEVHQREEDEKELLLIVPIQCDIPGYHGVGRYNGYCCYDSYSHTVEKLDCTVENYRWQLKPKCSSGTLFKQGDCMIISTVRGHLSRALRNYVLPMLLSDPAHTLSGVRDHARETFVARTGTEQLVS